MRSTMSELPDYWQREIKSLRAENAKFRRERNELRDELDALGKQSHPRSLEA